MILISQIYYLYFDAIKDANIKDQEESVLEKEAQDKNNKSKQQQENGGLSSNSKLSNTNESSYSLDYKKVGETITYRLWDPNFSCGRWIVYLVVYFKFWKFEQYLNLDGFKEKLSVNEIKYRPIKKLVISKKMGASAKDIFVVKLKQLNL